MKKKILIISYYWPPAGGPGVQRWLKFTKYLPEFGYEPYVYIPEKPSYPIIDNELNKDIHPDIKIIKRPIWEPYKWAEKLNKKNKNFKAGQFESKKRQNFLSKLSIYIRGNFFIPDARMFWIKPSIKFLKKYLEKNNIDTIITSGPPHSMHLIGLGLKKNNNQLKWIADFRDPWTKISYYSELYLNSFADLKHKKLEKEVLQSADLILATSYTDKENFKYLGGKKVYCITNGFDSDISNQHLQTSKFTISYVGMLEYLRNPQILWKALEKLSDEHHDFKKNFQLKLVGKIADSILEDLYESSISHNILKIGYVNHETAINEMNNSNMLIITSFPKEETKGIIPGKLFEYLATGKSIISIGPKNSDVEKILKETKAGNHFSYDENEIDHLKFYILCEFEKWKNKINSTKNIESIKKFHRKELTSNLAKIIESI